MRLALARFIASMMMTCSMIASLMGSKCDCTTNTSAPRTDSSARK
jgi:hypothetical protein